MGEGSALDLSASQPADAPSHADLVRRLEAESARNPWLYRTKLILLALFGLAFPVLVALVAVGTVVAMTVLTIWLAIAYEVRGLGGLVALAAVPLIYVAWVVVRSALFTFDKPAGVELTESNAPRLLEIVERVRRAVGGPPLAKVFADARVNAMIVEEPRWGYLAGSRTYLTIGVPLIQAMKVAELEAVLAHEFGHLVGGHARFGNWIYRVRATWARLLESLETRKVRGDWVFRRFFGWFAPFFNAYSYVLSRANEYDADRCSVAVAGPRVTADALVRSRVAGWIFEAGFRRGIMAMARTVPAPPADMLLRFPQYLRVNLFRVDLDAFLASDMARTTGVLDSHPCLSDRLAALGVCARLPPDDEQSAAERLFGLEIAAIALDVGEAWQLSIATEWQEAHKRHRDMARYRAELEEAWRNGSIDVDGRVHLAWPVGEMDGPAFGVDACLLFLKSHPGHVAARYHLGRYHLLMKDERGVEVLLAVAREDPDRIMPAARLISTFYLETGRVDAARGALDNARALYRRMTGKAPPAES